MIENTTIIDSESREDERALENPDDRKDMEPDRTKQYRYAFLFRSLRLHTFARISQENRSSHENPKKICQ